MPPAWEVLYNKITQLKIFTQLNMRLTAPQAHLGAHGKYEGISLRTLEGSEHFYAH